MSSIWNLTDAGRKYSTLDLPFSYDSFMLL